jgi:hypothetical protein
MVAASFPHVNKKKGAHLASKLTLGYTPILFLFFFFFFTKKCVGGQKYSFLQQLQRHLMIHISEKL